MTGMQSAILIADDNPATRSQLSGLVKDAGHDVELATCGAEALSCLAAIEFALVILDLEMPDFGGLEVLARHPGLLPPVIGLSPAGGRREDWGAAALAGWLQKPITADALRAVLDSTLSRGSNRTSGGKPPIDLDHLAVYTGGDAALERELAELFRISTGRYLTEMTQASDGSAGGQGAEAVDKAWRDAAHGLKGAARGIGAGEIARLAAFAETLVGRALVERRPDVLVELRAAVTDALAFFDAHTGAGSADDRNRDGQNRS